MEAVEEFNKIIDRLYYKYKSVEEMNYQTFLRDYIDWDYFVTVKLKNPQTGNIDYEFPDFYDISSLEDIANLNKYIFVVEHSATRYMPIVKTIVKKSLKCDFNFQDYTAIMNCLSDYFYQTTKDMLEIDSEDEEVVAISNYLLFIESASIEEIAQEFKENSEFSDLLIASYCSDYIERKAEEELEKEKKENPIINMQNSNDYIRNKLIYLIDYLVQMGYSEEDYIQVLSLYLASPYTLDFIDKKLYQIMYPNPNEEPYIKKYMIYIIIYDFYLTVTNDKFFPDVTEEDLEFADFIEKNPIEDIVTLFYNDEEFRKAAINNFKLLNMLPNFRNLYINDEIKNKFAPIYKIDACIKLKKSK